MISASLGPLRRRSRLGLRLKDRSNTPIMDFLEHWFHISPDGGGGLLEALFAVTVLLLIASALASRELSRMWSRNEDV